MTGFLRRREGEAKDQDLHYDQDPKRRRSTLTLTHLRFTTANNTNNTHHIQLLFILSTPAPYTYNLRYSMASQFAKVLGRPSWQQTMLRIADPKKSIPFYTETMGMTVIDTLDFPQWSFKLFFLTTLPDGEKYPLTPGTQEAHDYMWSIDGTALELTYNYGTEEESFKGYHAGNQEKDGFGHVAFNTDDVYAACQKLEEAGVSFKKKPDEGR
jgi:lactoylglutathione lyase